MAVQAGGRRPVRVPRTVATASLNLGLTLA